MIAPWVKSYVGIPFKSGGRTIHGLDCYGLIRLIYLEQFNKILPLLDLYSDADNFIETENVMKSYQPILAGQEVGTPEIGNVCVIKFHGLPVHLGIFVGDSFILHTLKGVGTVLQRCDDPNLRGRIEGWYSVD